MEHKPRKRFGQNFLHDPGIIQKLVAAIDPRPGQALVEIGPGLGALTRELLPAAGNLHVVELDRDLVASLPERCAGLGELHIHSADALKFAFRSLYAGHKLRIVGNLPYNISTPLLFHLLEELDIIQDMHFMLQKEVVDRLVAEPDCSDYGRLGIMVQYTCRVERLFNVPPGAFTPPPRVTSSVVRLIPHAQPPCSATDPRLLSQLLNQAFSRRRKTLRNALKGLLEVGDIQGLGIDPGVRPETLTVCQFVALANVLAEKT